MRDTQHPLQAHARQLRKAMTEAEQRLWQVLRGKQLAGHRFRRQVIIEPYIADFTCLEAQLVIEVDGGQHQEAARHDARRDAFLQGRGFRVLRFWNNEVMWNLPGVLETVLSTLASPHPNPPPRAGEGTKPLLPPAGEGRDGGNTP